MTENILVKFYSYFCIVNCIVTLYCNAQYSWVVDKWRVDWIVTLYSTAHPRRPLETEEFPHQSQAPT